MNFLVYEFGFGVICELNLNIVPLGLEPTTLWSTHERNIHCAIFAVGKVWLKAFNLVDYLSSPILSYLSRIMIKDIKALECANNRAKHFDRYIYLWLLPKIGDSLSSEGLQDTLRRSERECRKRSLVPSLPSTRSPRGLRAAYPSRSWVEVHLDQRTERLVSIFFDIFFDVPRTWKWTSEGFDLVIRCASEPAMPTTLPDALQPPHKVQKSANNSTNVRVGAIRKRATVASNPPPGKSQAP